LPTRSTGAPAPSNGKDAKRNSLSRGNLIPPVRVVTQSSKKKENQTNVSITPTRIVQRTTNTAQRRPSASQVQNQWGQEIVRAHNEQQKKSARSGKLQHSARGNQPNESLHNSKTPTQGARPKSHRTPTGHCHRTLTENSHYIPTGNSHRTPTGKPPIRRRSSGSIFTEAHQAKVREAMVMDSSSGSKPMNEVGRSAENYFPGLGHQQSPLEVELEVSKEAVSTSSTRKPHRRRRSSGSVFTEEHQAKVREAIESSRSKSREAGGRRRRGSSSSAKSTDSNGFCSVLESMQNSPALEADGNRDSIGGRKVFVAKDSQILLPENPNFEYVYVDDDHHLACGPASSRGVEDGKTKASQYEVFQGTAMEHQENCKPQRKISLPDIRNVGEVASSLFSSPQNKPIQPSSLSLI